VAELVAIITSADITARLDARAYLRLYAKSGGSTVDAAYVTTIVAEANSTFRTLTRAAFPEGVYSTTDTPDPAVVGWIVDLANGLAYKRGASFDAEGGYAVAAREARANIKLMNRDQDARAPGSSAERPLPVAALANDVDASGVTTHPYQGIRDGSIGSGY